jgi:hypothetical protein
LKSLKGRTETEEIMMLMAEIEEGEEEECT